MYIHIYIYIYICYIHVGLRVRGARDVAARGGGAIGDVSKLFDTIGYLFHILVTIIG